MFHYHERAKGHILLLLTLPALQWTAATFCGSFCNQTLTSWQKGWIKSTWGGLWSSNGKVATRQWNLDTSYDRSEHLDNEESHNIGKYAGFCISEKSMRLKLLVENLQIVDFIMPLMLCLQEAYNIINVVAVYTFQLLCRITHCYDVVTYIYKLCQGSCQTQEENVPFLYGSEQLITRFSCLRKWKTRGWIFLMIKL